MLRAIRPGQLGQIFVNESLIETLLYIGRTRELFARTLERDLDFPEMLPANVLAEVASLYEYWDSWKPGIRLNVAAAHGVPSILPEETIGSLIPLLPDYDPVAVRLMTIVVAHEYAHLVQENDPEGRDLLLESARALLTTVPQLAMSGDGDLVYFRDLLARNEKLTSSWLGETAADLGAVLSLIHQSGEERSWLMAFSVLCLIQALIESYSKAHAQQSLFYPVSFLRILLVVRFMDAIMNSERSDLLAIGANAFDSLRRLRASLARLTRP